MKNVSDPAMDATALHRTSANLKHGRSDNARRAVRFLSLALADGHWHRAAEVYEDALARGIPKPTLRTARQRTCSVRGGGRNHPHEWRLLPIPRWHPACFNEEQRGFLLKANDPAQREHRSYWLCRAAGYSKYECQGG